MTQMTIGDLLRHCRRDAGLNQKAIAQAIGCDHTLVSRVENGIQFPSQVYIERFIAIEALALSDAERQGILSVYEYDRQARRSPLTEGASAIVPSSSIDQDSQPSHVQPVEANSTEVLASAIVESEQKRPQAKHRWSIRRHATLVGVLAIVIVSLSMAIPALFQATASGTTAHLVVDSFQLTTVDSSSGQMITATYRYNQIFMPTFIVTVGSGEPVTVSIQVRNESQQTMIIPNLVAGVRGPNAHDKGWQSPKFDFPHVLSLTLQPGETFTYIQTRSFAIPGDFYFIEPVKMNADGQWGGIRPFPRIWFNVKEATGRPHDANAIRSKQGEPVY